ncbi:alpha/beta hydrolase fold domain-containing protein, partial [Mycobacterium sp. E342]|uniref:alpha/beta hydrolase fold domain-containing protein n=1 Tax=Mycobacterium sp. E342 TaxID=1834147 RepID=UPI000AE6F8A5
GVRIYWPPSYSQDAAAPVVLYFHGGGFVVGDLDSYDGTARQHAVGTEAIVVSVDYRLAPEHTYPAAVEIQHDGRRRVLRIAWRPIDPDADRSRRAGDGPVLDAQLGVQRPARQVAEPLPGGVDTVLGG